MLFIKAWWQQRVFGSMLIAKAEGRYEGEQSQVVKDSSKHASLDMVRALAP
jgi:hypothetical protein